MLGHSAQRECRQDTCRLCEKLHTSTPPLFNHMTKMKKKLRQNRRTLLVAENEIWLVSDRIHDEPGFRKSDFHICLSGYPKELQILQFLLIP